ncbi:hypothetical protein HY477_00360 [Candidatus Uhrbacteria bacterium]|nr:hypothetical protein [Candidatus Uhrbacteria bacterium]
MSRDTRTPTPEDLGIAPETPETEGYIEIEVKIVHTKSEHSTPEGLQKKIEALGGTLEIPRRMLEDVSFRREKKATREARTYILTLKDFKNQQGLERVLSLLGLKILRRDGNEIAVHTSGGSMPKRTVRLRRDGEQFVWGVKEPREEGKKFDERREEEVSVIRPRAVEEILNALGYTRDTERQKYRSTFRLDKTLVELNEGPKAPPWIEVEGDSAQKATSQDVFDTVDRLGYAKSDTAAISDADYYRMHGVNDEELRNLKFSQ